MVIQDLEKETGLNGYGAQHGFVPVNSTITIMRALYDWTDASRARHVIGVFLDITGAFDSVGWFPVLSKLNTLGASICEAVFLPCVTYAKEVWAEWCRLKKSISTLCSVTKSPTTKAITSCYRTASTNCLTVVAGVLPLDLEVCKKTLKGKMKAGEIQRNEYDSEVEELIRLWWQRYNQTDKGDRTKKMIPDVGQRYALPMCLNHYTSQMLTGPRGLFTKLHQFKLVEIPSCKCSIGGAETVAHALLRCKRTEPYRNTLKTVLSEEGEDWLPRDRAFLKTRKTYEALRIFAKQSLCNREDR